MAAPTSEERREVALTAANKWRGRQMFACILRNYDSWPVILYKRKAAYSLGMTAGDLADLIEPPEITEDTSDGYHTFAQLYYQRMMLFAVLVQEHKDRAWKTWNHEDGEPCFGGGWFLVTIDTPRGAYGYHYEEKYWNLFDCKELPKAKHWDGYTEENVNRLFSLLGYEVSGDATDQR